MENEKKFYYCDGKQLQPLDLHGQDGKDGKDGISWLVSTSPAPTAECPYGGILVNVGPDTNANGLLDFDEITSTQPICAPAPDSILPSVIVKQTLNQVDPTDGATIEFAVIFSESMTGFDASDLSFAGSTAGGLLKAEKLFANSFAYLFNVTGMNSPGTVVMSVPAGKAIGTSGLPNAASKGGDNVVTFTGNGPSVTIDQAAGQPDPTTQPVMNFTVVFSEPVTDFTADDIVFSEPNASPALVPIMTVTGSGTTYNVSVGAMSPGTAMLSIPEGAVLDANSHPNHASTSTDNAVTYAPPPFDPPPSATITLAPGVSDPTSTGPLAFLVTFSEPVVGFTKDDIQWASVVNGGTSTLALADVTGSGATYTVSFFGFWTGPGSLGMDFLAGAATDLGGNPSLAPTLAHASITLTYP